MPARTAYPGTQAVGDVLTSANFTKTPGGWIGREQVTANQTTIGTSGTDLTGLSIAVTVGSGRTLRITGQAMLQSKGSAHGSELAVYEGATRLNTGRIEAEAQDSFSTCVVVAYIVSPSAGSHTYKLRATASANTTDMLAGADFPAFILVEDIGPSS